MLDAPHERPRSRSRRESPVDHARETLHVEQHVDRHDDDQHRREEQRHDRDRRSLGPLDRLRRVARDVLRAGVVQELEPGFCTFTRSRWCVVQPRLEADDVALGLRRGGCPCVVRKVVVDPLRGRLRLVDDDGRERDAGKDDESREREIHERDRETAWDPRPAEAADDRVEQQRDQPGDEEKEDDVTHGAGDRPRHDQHERQPDELDPPRDNQPRRPSRVHADDRTAGASASARAAAWDWSFLEDGALALDRHELWTDVEPPPRLRLLQAKVATI